MTEMSEDRRSQEKRFAYLVRDEGCQTSPLGHLPTGMADSSWKDALKSRASSEGPDRMARCLEAEVGDWMIDIVCDLIVSVIIRSMFRGNRQVLGEITTVNVIKSIP